MQAEPVERHARELLGATLGLLAAGDPVSAVAGRRGEEEEAYKLPKILSKCLA